MFPSYISLNGIRYTSEQILQMKADGEPLYLQQIFSFLKEWFSDSAYVRVKTSGSTGAPKEYMVEKEKMRNSALMTCRFFALDATKNALLCMSAEYIAGKMMLVRAIVSGMNLVCVEPCGNPLRDIASKIDFAAMVPMQLYNTLQHETETCALNRIGDVIVGGGAVRPSLTESLHTLRCSVWSTYGMTETLSHIALRRLNGKCASAHYTPLQGVRVTLAERGTLDIEAPLLCDGILHTNDVAALHDDGTFDILGRIDNTVCSGGIKIQLERMEEKLQQVLDFPFAATSVPDEKFGEALVLLVATDTPDSALLPTIRKALPKFWLPKHIVHCAEIPLTPTAKPDRKAIRKIAEKKV